MLRISRATPLQAAALSAVARATFLETFADLIPVEDILSRARDEDSPDAFLRHLEADHPAWLASHPATDAPVGFALLTPPDLPDVDTLASDLELKRIYLLHRFHGQGAGARLHAAVMEEARARGATRLLLGVYAHNPTLQWYAAQGYRRIGTRSFQVGESQFDDLILAKTL